MESYMDQVMSIRGSVPVVTWQESIYSTWRQLTSKPSPYRCSLVSSEPDGYGLIL